MTFELKLKIREEPVKGTYPWDKYRTREDYVRSLQRHFPDFDLSTISDLDELIEFRCIDNKYAKLNRRGRTILRHLSYNSNTTETKWPYVMNGYIYRIYYVFRNDVIINAPALALGDFARQRHSGFLCWCDSQTKYFPTIRNYGDLEATAFIPARTGFDTSKLIVLGGEPLTDLRTIPKSLIGQVSYFNRTGEVTIEGLANPAPISPAKFKQKASFLTRHHNFMGYPTDESIRLVRRARRWGNFNGIHTAGSNIFVAQHGNKLLIINSRLRGGWKKFSPDSEFDGSSPILASYCVYEVGKNLGLKILPDIISYVKALNHEIKPTDKEIDAVKLLNQYSQRRQIDKKINSIIEVPLRWGM